MALLRFDGGGDNVDESETTEMGILITFQGVADCMVRLASGQEVAAAMDVEKLRAVHGRVYGININGAVRVARRGLLEPWRIIWLEQK